MNIKSASAGTLESSDILIQITPLATGMGTEIDLESAVIYQFGTQIRQVIAGVLAEEGIVDVKVLAVDRGALDCTIKARVRTAISRSREV